MGTAAESLRDHCVTPQKPIRTRRDKHRDVLAASFVAAKHRRRYACISVGDSAAFAWWLGRMRVLHPPGSVGCAEKGDALASGKYPGSARDLGTCAALFSSSSALRGRGQGLRGPLRP